MNPAAIHTTFQKLKAVDVERFEREDWHTDLARVEQLLWRNKKPADDATIGLLDILDACGVKTCLRALGAADAAGQRIARLIAADMALLAVIPLRETDIGRFCERSWNQINRVLETGGAIEASRDLAVSMKQLGDLRIHQYSQAAEYSALRAVGSIVFPYEGPPDDPKDLEAIGDLCALEVLDCVLCARPQIDGRYVAAARLADLGTAAEKRWQKGTNLKFKFCTEEISAAMCDLENALLDEFKPEILKQAAAIAARRLGRRP